MFPCFPKVKAPGDPLLYILTPEAAHFLVSTKNYDLWAGPTPEVRDSQTFCESDKSDWLKIGNENRFRPEVEGKYLVYPLS